MSSTTTPPSLKAGPLISDLQSCGARLADPRAGAASRRGGAGPSDHKAVTLDGMTVMVPVHTAPAFESRYVIEAPDRSGRSLLLRDGEIVGRVTMPAPPRFYALRTADGVPYSQIATLHGRDVLATTVLQSCIRYQSRTRACRFCAIGQSLAAGRTIDRKTPAQLAEVARAAVALDGVRHMVMTTGTPPGPDRGAAILAESAAAVKAAVDLPIEAQCEPPEDFGWFRRMLDAGVDALGLHLEAVGEATRRLVMPGKAEITVERMMVAFAAAVAVFGHGQVSSYVIAGLGDTQDEILQACGRMIGLGVYPFVVPFVPISGTPMESHAPPDRMFMHGVLAPLARLLSAAGMGAERVKAGCARCGACSALAAYEAGLA